MYRNYQRYVSATVGKKSLPAGVVHDSVMSPGISSLKKLLQSHASSHINCTYNTYHVSGTERHPTRAERASVILTHGKNRIKGERGK